MSFSSGNFLEFEKSIVELEAKIEGLKSSSDAINLQDEINNLKKKSDQLTKEVFSNLNPWKVVQLSRHPSRPHTQDYIKYIFNDFFELSGDRLAKDDYALITGIAKLNDQPVAIIGHRKGRELEEKMKCNFGMPSPEGYRKAQRIMKLAERFKIPLITFIDTPGAYPGIDAEKHGQSEAIASCMSIMSDLEIPIISIVIGEGGSGGALAIGVNDKIFMLNYAIYSVISPEGCASILWKTAEKAEEAAKAMNITAKDLLEHNLIDGIIAEPLGGAHRNYNLVADNVKQQLEKTIMQLQKTINDKEDGLKQLLSNRYEKLMSYKSIKVN